MVIPAYNGAATLAASVDAVLAQTYSNIETLVVDDGSTDDTAAVLARYGDRVRTIKKPNGGLASARNVGTRAARGELVAMVDADDICEPERVAMQVALAHARPEAVVCSTAFSAFSEEGFVAASYGASYYSMIGMTPGGVSGLYGPPTRLSLATGTDVSVETDVYVAPVYDLLARGNFVHPPTIFFRKTLFDTVGEFDTALRFTCDWDWLVRASRLGPFSFIDRPLLGYRLSASQMSGGKNSAKAALENLRILEKICEQDPALFTRDRERLRAYLAEFCLDAAEAHADSHIVKTVELLARGMRYGAGPQKAALKIFVKAFVPKAVLVSARKLRGIGGNP